jgi:hypothetical protein
MASLFAFRMRAYAAAHFAFDEHIEVRWPDATAMFQSEYTGGADGRAYPVTLFGEIRGPGDSRDGAQAHLAATIGNALPTIALAANAAIDDPLAVGVFGLDLSEPQEFLWYATPRPEVWFPPGARKIDPHATLALMTAVGHHAETELLQRAIESYRRALSNWVPERRLMAGEFLFIAAETLSRCLVKTRSSEKGITAKNLARLMGASDQDALRRTYLCDEIFAGDDDALAAMEAASNGFEHGYMTTEQVRGLIDSVLERSMTAVRRALISTSAVEASAERRTLLDAEYAEPRGLVPAMHVVTGEIARKNPSLPAPEDLASLDIEFPRPVPTATQDPDGTVKIDLPATLTAKYLPDNVELRVQGVGLRAAYMTKVAPSRIDVTQAPTAPRAE